MLNSKDDHLFRDVAQLSSGGIFPMLVRAYAGALLSQASAVVGVESLAKLPVEVISGVNGLRRKINLGRIERFDDESGARYLQKSFEDMIIPALVKCYPKIGLVEYDHLYLMSGSLLVDCKGRQLLEAIVRNGDAKMHESVDACRISYLPNLGKIDVYEHDCDPVRLVEHVFPGSGLVYYATEQRGLVSRILSHYAVNHQGEFEASIDGGKLELGSRKLKIGFLGEVALSEFDKHEGECGPDKEKRLTASSIRSALREL
jgi:hypothetical protein